MYDNKLDRLFALPNVRHLGAFDVEMLPALLRRMDLLMMLYSQDRDVWTFYSGPAKLFEYMAIGKPILSTPHPAVEPYRRFITLVEDGGEFVSAVRAWERAPDAQRLAEMSEEARRYLWEDRARTILLDLV